MPPVFAPYSPHESTTAKSRSGAGLSPHCGVAFVIAGVIHNFLGAGPASDAMFIGVLGVLLALLGCINPER